MPQGTNEGVRELLARKSPIKGYRQERPGTLGKARRRAEDGGRRAEDRRQRSAVGKGRARLSQRAAPSAPSAREKANFERPTLNVELPIKKRGGNFNHKEHKVHKEILGRPRSCKALISHSLSA